MDTQLVFIIFGFLCVMSVNSWSFRREHFGGSQVYETIEKLLRESGLFGYSPHHRRGLEENHRYHGSGEYGHFRLGLHGYGGHEYSPPHHHGYEGYEYPAHHYHGYEGHKFTPYRHHGYEGLEHYFHRHHRHEGHEYYRHRHHGNEGRENFRRLMTKTQAKTTPASTASSTTVKTTSEHVTYPEQSKVATSPPTSAAPTTKAQASTKTTEATPAKSTTAKTTEPQKDEIANLLANYFEKDEDNNDDETEFDGTNQNDEYHTDGSDIMKLFVKILRDHQNRNQEDDVIEAEDKADKDSALVEELRKVKDILRDLQE